MKNEVDKLRDGIFALHTRRFGSVAERIVIALYGFREAKSKYYDAIEPASGSKVEIKFSRATEKQAPLTDRNLIEQCSAASNLVERALSGDDVRNYSWDSNIQQVKPEEFDTLYYGLFFSDKIEIFKMTSNDVESYERNSNKQHYGNVGEGQFHFDSKTYAYHKQNHFDRELTYDEVYKIFDELRSNCK